MIEVQIDLSTKDNSHTFDVPVKLTRKQLEKMLRAVDSDDAPGVPHLPTGTPTIIAVKKATDLIEITKRRSKLLSGAKLFADPAWFILLDLFVRQNSGLQTSVSSACHASFSPLTTALRHIAILTERKIIRRRFDLVDQRRVFLELTDETNLEIERILLADHYKDLSFAS